MWTRHVPQGPKGRFGHGSYHTTDSFLVETDDEMMKALDTMGHFKFELTMDGDDFSQITVDIDGNRTFPENYRRIDWTKKKGVRSDAPYWYVHGFL